MAGNRRSEIGYQKSEIPGTKKKEEVILVVELL
jgi:hypothetical protein